MTRSLIKKDGGAKADKAKMPMRSTKYIDSNGNEIVQQMQHANGLQKGLLTILTERGRDVAGKNKDQLEAMLKQEEDFQNQQIWLREIATNDGMEVEFFPKFHCEFNWIERYWCHTKRNVRKNCDYSFKTLVEAVPKYLNEVDVITMRRYARKSFRYIDAYRQREGEEDVQLTPAIVEWNVKQYSSHRRIDKLLKYEEHLEKAAEEVPVGEDEEVEHDDDEEEDDEGIFRMFDNDDM